MRTRFPPAVIASVQAGVGGVIGARRVLRRVRSVRAEQRVTDTEAVIAAVTQDVLAEPFTTFDVADGIEREAHGAGGAVEPCSAAVERSDTTKE